MNTGTEEVWPRGLPTAGQRAERSRALSSRDIEVRTDRPITKLRTEVVRDDGTVVIVGEALCYTMPLRS